MKISSASVADASMTCSQLSSTSRILRVRRHSISVASASSVWIVRPSVDAMVAATSFGSVTMPSVDEAHRVSELFEHRVRDGDGDGGFAHAAGADDAHESIGDEVGRDGAHGVVAAHHSRELRRQERAVRRAAPHGYSGARAGALAAAPRVTGATKQ